MTTGPRVGSSSVAWDTPGGCFLPGVYARQRNSGYTDGGLHPVARAIAEATESNGMLRAAVAALIVLRDGHPTDDHRLVFRVVQLVGLGDARRGEYVHGLRHRGRIGGAMWVGAGRGTHAELEVLRSGLETACLIRAEPVLAGQHHREDPARRRCAAERCLVHGERDVPRDLVGADGDGAHRVRIG